MTTTPLPPSHPRQVTLALVYLYLVWGTSYLANRYALIGLPPLLAGGSRFLCGGLILALWSWPRGQRVTLRQVASAGLIGCLLLTVGSGCVVYAQQHVHSSLAAISVASVGLWTCVSSRLLGQSVSAREWLGVALGLLGVVVLNWDRNLQHHPRGAMALLIGAMAWGLGTSLSRRLPMPSGLQSSAIQMLCGGSLLLVLSQLRGEKLQHWPPTVSILAFLYLLIFASLIAFSAYNYLMQNVKPSLATSYAYINPLIAVALGHYIAGERVGDAALGGLALILGALMLVARRPQSEDRVR